MSNTGQFVERNPYTPPEANITVNEQRVRPMRRPVAATRAVQLLWGSLAIGPINLILDWKYLGSVMPIGNTVITVAMTAALLGWLNIKFGVGRNWARITFLVLTLLGLPLVVMMLPATLKRFPVEGALQAVQALLQLFALYLLFSAPGKSWFLRRAVESSYAA